VARANVDAQQLHAHNPYAGGLCRRVAVIPVSRTGEFAPRRRRDADNQSLSG